MRERYPKCRMIYKIGNHEERWEKYMWLKAPELSGVSEFEIYDILNFSKYGVEEVKGKQKIKAGNHLTIIHGHEMFNSTAPVNFARTLQTNLGCVQSQVTGIKPLNTPLKMQTISIYIAGH